MPERPEVYTVLKTLENQMQHPTIEAVNVKWDNIISGISVDEFKIKLIGQTFREYLQLGKYLIFKLDDYCFIAHLRMEGKFFYDFASELPDSKHNHVFFKLSDGKELVYHDVRKFGKMYLYPIREDYENYPCFKNIGYDVFDERLTPQFLMDKFKRRASSPIKTLLLDQGVIAGIGNIYADEICYDLKIHPAQKNVNYDLELCDAIINSTRKIISKAMAEGGTTIRSYTSSLGVSGRFQLYLNVHMREGEPCHHCQTIIEKTKVGGRGTYFCPKEQVCE